MTDQDVASLSAMLRGFFVNRRLPVELQDDAVQEVLLAVLRNEHGIQCLSAYAATVAKYYRWAAARRTTFEHNTLCGLGSAYRAAAANVNPLAEAEAAERLRFVEARIATLPRLYRELLRRFYFAGEPAERICADLGITRKQFDLEKSRAKRRLADRVQGAGLMRPRSSPACSANQSAKAA